MADWDRPAGIHVKDIMVLKGVAMGKTYREIQKDILVKSRNSVKEYMQKLKLMGYVTYEPYGRDRRLTAAGRELLKKATS